MPVRRELPSGTVTFVFTDVEGSTKLLHERGAEQYAQALADHRRIVRDAFTRHGGVEVDTQGDAFFVAFPTAPGALAAAAKALEGLSAGPIRVRIGIHTGTPHLAEEGYVGADVHRAARIAAAGHGGQVLVSAATAALLDANDLRDLGHHRLKDLSAPERIYQLGGRDFPPLKSLHQTNLPIPATPFLGRERELSEVSALLARDHLRLLTLTGPGGTGKTRLALQAAGDAADAFAGGVFWVPLAPLRDPALVLEQAAQALGAQDGLAEHIGDRSLLLFFDNFEHLVEAAEELPPLLAACPNVRVLVTSRELLRLPGEQAYPVPQLEPQEGTEFFLARARAANPAFESTDAVANLCARLEHLPLALELAAARIRVLSTEQVLERLSGRLDLLKAGRGVDPRQKTLRATIEWSHELLVLEQQQLFARLSVFRGGCTLETTEEVCEADLDILQSLVDKSLLRHTKERFWMLETIREYAAERLEDSGEGKELRCRHAEHYVALVEEAEPHLSASAGKWLDRLEGEHDNLRAALDWCTAAGESQLALRLAGAVYVFWEMRGHLAEGRRRLETALCTDERPTAARAKALNGAAALALGCGDAATARLRAEEGLALHRTLEDTSGTGSSLLELGLVIADQGDYASALEIFEESIRFFREAHDEHSVVWATRYLAWMHDELGDRKHARALHEDNLARARALGAEWIEASTLGALGEYAIDEGRLDEGGAMLRQSVRLFRGLGERERQAENACRFARALVAAGSPSIAARLLASAEALQAEIGARRSQWLVEMNEGTLRALQAQLDDAAFAEAWEQGRALTVDDAVALAVDSLEA
jgi:predicted ATPase/class 3 adenylate cyclase